MRDFLDNLKTMVEELGSAPTIEEMPRRNLSDKWINGPTAAHVIEEVHSPLNLAYLTFTTGSSAFQNIVGITHAELEQRVKASHEALRRIGLQAGERVLFTYPPLVNVFSKVALEDYDTKVSFLRRSSRDAFLAALYEEQPKAVLGESSFLRAALEDARKMGIIEYLPHNCSLITAGTPLDLELIPVAEKTLQSQVFDLYGCQEFGWLYLNGVPLREDLSLVESPIEQKGYCEVVVGGLPMGDSFPVAESGHLCNPEGKVITYRRRRTHPEYEVYVRETTLAYPGTANRVARSILRLKSRVVKVAPDVQVSAPHTVLELRPAFGASKGKEPLLIQGPEKTIMFDDLVRAQLEYQQSSKTDPTWRKER